MSLLCPRLSPCFLLSPVILMVFSLSYGVSSSISHQFYNSLPILFEWTWWNSTDLFIPLLIPSVFRIPTWFISVIYTFPLRISVLWAVVTNLSVSSFILPKSLRSSFFFYFSLNGISPNSLSVFLTALFKSLLMHMEAACGAVAEEGCLSSPFIPHTLSLQSSELISVKAGDFRRWLQTVLWLVLMSTYHKLESPE